MNLFRNYTSDEIVLTLPNDEELRFPSLGIAYITGKNIIIDRIDGVEIRKKCYNEINGIPDENTEIIYIVSRAVAHENSRRENRRIDLVYPDTDHHDCLHDKNSIRTITGFVFQ